MLLLNISLAHYNPDFDSPEAGRSFAIAASAFSKSVIGCLDTPLLRPVSRPVSLVYLLPVQLSRVILRKSLSNLMVTSAF